jgi:hypothetical protein
MTGTQPFPAFDQRRTTRKHLESSQLMRDSGEEFLAEALAQAYQDLDETEAHVERLEDALHAVEEECARIAEGRQDMLTRMAELTAQVEAMRGDAAAPAPIQAASVPVLAPPVQAAPVQAAPAPVEARRPRMSVRETLDRVSQWMWDDPPDDRDEHIARSLRSRWRAGFVLACMLALVGVAGMAVAVGIPEVQNNLESKTAAIEAPAHYSSTPLIREGR